MIEIAGRMGRGWTMDKRRLRLDADSKPRLREKIDGGRVRMARDGEAVGGTAENNPTPAGGQARIPS